MQELFSPLGMIAQILTMMLAVGSLLIRYRRHGQDAWDWPVVVSTGAMIGIWIVFFYVMVRQPTSLTWIWFIYAPAFAWAVWEAWVNLGKSDV